MGFYFLRFSFCFGASLGLNVAAALLLGHATSGGLSGSALDSRVAAKGSADEVGALGGDLSADGGGTPSEVLAEDGGLGLGDGASTVEASGLKAEVHILASARLDVNASAVHKARLREGVLVGQVEARDKVMRKGAERRLEWKISTRPWGISEFTRISMRTKARNRSNKNKDGDGYAWKGQGGQVVGRPSIQRYPATCGRKIYH